MHTNKTVIATIFKQQWGQVLVLFVLLLGLYGLIKEDPTFFEGTFWNIDTSTWGFLVLLTPIVHQCYVLICWRLEYFFGTLSRYLGSACFHWFAVGFYILLGTRFISLFFLALSNANTLDIDPLWSRSLIIVLLFPIGYLCYSVVNYFGCNRALGVDHFKPEAYRGKPLIKKGIFAYTSNGMYVFGFLVLWLPGLLFHSKAACAGALFNHLFIWGHYYFTERPDMRLIYKNI